PRCTPFPCISLTRSNPVRPHCRSPPPNPPFDGSRSTQHVLNPASPSIAIVGMACIYPDARTPGELWENVLAQRRAFRRLPPERLRAEDYWSADPATPDASYAMEAAVIEG